MSKTIEKTYKLSWLPLLGILFVGLKLTDQIDWSWIWVLLPFWIGPGIVLAAMSILAGLWALAWIGEKLGAG